MLPCEIEADAKDMLFDSTEIIIWITAMQKIQEIKLHLKRFGQIVHVETDEDCTHIFESFAESTKSKIQELWEEFAACEYLVDQLIKNTNGQILDMVDVVKKILGCYDELIECIIAGQDTGEIVQLIDTISTIMLFLQPVVSNIICSNKN